jgi:hypothetical protein
MREKEEKEKICVKQKRKMAAKEERMKEAEGRKEI